MNTSVCSGINILQDFGIALAAVTINKGIGGFLDRFKANNSGHGGEIRGAIMVAMVMELMVVNLGIPLWILVMEEQVLALFFVTVLGGGGMGLVKERRNR